MKTIQLYKTKSNFTVTEQAIDGVTYWKVPVVMIREGVHNGSRGAVLHTTEELTKTVPDWVGIPVVIDHPQNENGDFISANSEGVHPVGTIASAMMVRDKLSAILSLRPDLLDETLKGRIQDGEIIEVSVGIYSNEVEQEGEWNGEKYKKISTNMIPDHLAILPNDTGACSVKDGCGIRVNKEYKGGQMNYEEDRLRIKSEPTIQVNASNLTTRISGISELVRGLDQLPQGEGSHWLYAYVEEIWDTFVIYEVREKGQPVKLYQRNYQVDENDVVKWTEDAPVELQRKVSYVKQQNNKGMENCNCPERVEALIQNEFTAFQETDREWLSSLPAERLDSLTPIPQKTITVNRDEVRAEFLQSLQTIEDLLAITPEHLKEPVLKGMEYYKEYRAGLVTAIMANTESGVWTEEDLQGQETTMLEKLSRSFKTTTYMVPGGDLNTNKEKPQVLVSPL